jgi:NAD(P)-dependent dehydrogenase (short-subunit alcohol dehydrogenase family)
LDVVVANAGIELIEIPLIEYTEEQYDRVFDVNTKGTFFTLQEAARRVRMTAGSSWFVRTPPQVLFNSNRRG